MRPIEQALQEVRNLHERVTRHPAPEISPQAFLPFPPGMDPVTYAIEEVTRLRQLIEQAAAPAESGPTWVPRADVYAGNTGLCFLVEIPGVNKDDLEVTVVGQELVVRGRRAAVAGEEQQALRVERECGGFERRFPLPNWCAQDAVQASCNDGLLEIQVARSETDGTGEFRVEIG